mmetsp:Transcript_52503/g.94153  ORF Transcript_52503/g.94153 Transcript_52503/m.94153 type:complete len:232 (-) Transcript_52503:39-734(-)
MQVILVSLVSLQSPLSLTMMRCHSEPLITLGSGGVVYLNHSSAISDKFSICPKLVGKDVKLLWCRYSVCISLHCPSPAGISSMKLSPKLRLFRFLAWLMALGKAFRRFWLSESALRFGRAQTSSGISRKRFWSRSRSSRETMTLMSGESSSSAFFRKSKTFTWVKASRTCLGIAVILWSFRSRTCRLCCAAAVSKAFRLSVPSFAVDSDERLPRGLLDALVLAACVALMAF